MNIFKRFYIKRFKKFRIPVDKVLRRLNYLEAEGWTTDKACDLITGEILEGKYEEAI